MDHHLIGLSAGLQQVTFGKVPLKLQSSLIAQARPVFRSAAATPQAPSTSLASRSNKVVNRECGSAHGTRA